MIQIIQLKCTTCNNITVKRVSRVNQINKWTVIIVVCGKCRTNRPQLVMREIDEEYCCNKCLLS